MQGDAILRGKGGETLLMRAVKTNPDAAFKLIKKKKDINATNVKGQTALMMAVENNPQLVAPLIEYGANVNVFDKDGNTPLMLAQKYALEVEDILVAAGAKNVKPMRTGMKLPIRREFGDSDETFVIEMTFEDGTKQYLKAKLRHTLRFFAERLLRDDIVNENDKIEVQKIGKEESDDESGKKTKKAQFTLSKEVFGFRLDLDARFGEYPDFFEAGKTTDMQVMSNSGLLKLKNLMHDNWKEAKKFALNTEDAPEIMNDDPSMHMELETDDEDNLVYYRDKNDVLRLIDFQSLKSWLDFKVANPPDYGNIRDLTSAADYTFDQIQGLLDIVNNRSGFNMVISYHDISKQKIDYVTLLNLILFAQPRYLFRNLFDGKIDISDVVNTNTSDGSTLLILAVKKQPNLVQYLIDGGADVNVRDRNGMTALSYAIGKKNSIIQALINAGADVNTKSEIGMPLIPWVAYSRPELVQTLIDAGADVDVTDSSGVTALMAASSRRQPLLSAVQALINAGANVNARDGSGRTPLFHAMIRRDPSVVQTLIDADADVNARNEDGKSVLEFARDENIKSLLRRAGARE